MDTAAWSADAGVLDSSYFRGLTQTHWAPRNTSSGLAFYMSPSGMLALIPDIALAWDVGVGAQETDSARDPKYCVPHSASARACPVQTAGSRAWVERFAADRSSFYRSFAAAWAKMQGLGTGGALADPCPDDAPTCAAPEPPPCVEPPADPASPAEGCRRSALAVPGGGTYECFIDLGMQDFRLHWRVGAGAAYFGAQSRSEGWVGVAFAEVAGRMTPAKGVIGWAGGGGVHVGPYDISSTSGARYANPSAEAGSSFGYREADAAAEEVESVTTLHFAADVCGSTGVPAGACLDASAPLDINVAYHPTTDAMVPHPLGAASARSVRIDLLGGSAEVVSVLDRRTARRQHGVAMIAAWVFLAPCAVFFRRYGKPVFNLGISASVLSRAAFMLHVAPGLAGTAVALWGFAIAFDNFWTFGRPGLAHSWHSELGHVVFILTLLQPLSGLGVVTGCRAYGTWQRTLLGNLHRLGGWALSVTSAVEIALGLHNLRDLDATWTDFQYPVIVGLAVWASVFGFAELLKRCFMVRRRNTDGQGVGIVSGVITNWDYVKHHNKITDCWVVIDSKAYDVTDFLPIHPGGVQLLMDHAGRDATEAFNSVEHSASARRLLQRYYRADVEHTRVLNSIRLAEEVTSRLVELDLAGANDIVHKSAGEDLPEALCRAFLRLVSNLRMYREFLPASLLDAESSEMGALVAAVPPPIGELSLAFTDICGSTQLWERSPRGMEHAMDIHNRVIREALLDTGGYEVKTIGDAFMAAFASAAEAGRFACTVQEEFDKQLWPTDDDLPSMPTYGKLHHRGTAIFNGGIRLRIGINHGKVEHEHNELTGRVDYRGPMVNAAARIENAAVPGAVLVSQCFVDAAAGEIDKYDIRCRLLGQVELRGVKEPQQLCMLISPGLRGRERWAVSQFRQKHFGSRDSTGGDSRSDVTPHSTHTEPASVPPSPPVVLTPTSPNNGQPPNPLGAFPRQTSEVRSPPASLQRRGSDLFSGTPSGGSRSSLAVPDGEWHPVDNRLQSRAQSFLKGGVCTLALVGMLTPSETVNASRAQGSELAGRCSVLLSSLYEAAARNSGKVLGLTGGEVLVSWNVINHCATHAVMGMNFINVLQAPDRPPSTLGMATCFVLHGTLLCGRHRYTTAMGPANTLARQALDSCGLFGARALAVFYPRTPRRLQGMLRPVDSWGLLGRQLTVEEPIRGAFADNAVFSLALQEPGSPGSPARRRSTLSFAGDINAQYRTAFMEATKGDEMALESITEIAAALPGDNVLQIAADLLREHVGNHSTCWRVPVTRETSWGGGFPSRVGTGEAPSEAPSSPSMTMNRNDTGSYMMSPGKLPHAVPGVEDILMD
eukprot:TRINITY_DN5473_c0_g2_i1.p1 TRINITY_DN5473_c0_g2~~TRINITY_DN5473_c0_g2_i1.p1  ORF type:complete len:1581 (+),score=475.53 TRINITY_DN5473_c0_g2_i1:713-4744(+)